MTASAVSDPPRVRQTSYSLAVAAVLVATIAAVAGLSHNRAISQCLIERQTTRCRQHNDKYIRRGGFSDAEDRLLLGDLVAADYSRGGVYFFGSSTMQHALMDWELPEALEPYVKNYAISSANFREQFQFVRFLVESEGLLQAGGEKVLVVLGLSHFDTRLKQAGLIDGEFVPNLFARHGLFDYDPRAALSRRQQPALVTYFETERARSRSFLQALGAEVTAESKPGDPDRLGPQALARAKSLVASILGNDRWREAQQEQLHELTAMVDYLRQRNVQVCGVLLPLASWNREQPYAERFGQEVAQIFADQRLPLEDLSSAVGDSGFRDPTHLNWDGEQQISPRLEELARKHLASIGIAESGAAASGD